MAADQKAKNYNQTRSIYQDCQKRNYHRIVLVGLWDAEDIAPPRRNEESQPP